MIFFVFCVFLTFCSSTRASYSLPAKTGYLDPITGRRSFNDKAKDTERAKNDDRSLRRRKGLSLALPVTEYLGSFNREAATHLIFDRSGFWMKRFIYINYRFDIFLHH